MIISANKISQVSPRIELKWIIYFIQGHFLEMKRKKKPLEYLCITSPAWHNQSNLFLDQEYAQFVI